MPFGAREAGDRLTSPCSRIEPGNQYSRRDAATDIGQTSEFGASGLEALKTRLTNLFERCTAKLSVIVIEIRFQGDVAHDYGWHDLTLTPKDGGESIRRRYRYVDIWRRNKKGNWKLWMYMDNQDVADPFRPDQIPSVGAQVHGSF